MSALAIDPHPTLRVRVFESTFPALLGESPSPARLVELLQGQGEAPLQRNEQVRAEVRDLLRHGGYKPTGRGKPASEYLVRAFEREELSPINLAVDACNAVSLHSGLPISVVDLDLVRQPLRIGIVEEKTSYVFNASGQEIGLQGLLCLFDAEGPCANGVKDSQRTKTHPGTRRSLSVVWGSQALEERLERATQWYRSLLEECGVATEPWSLATSS